MKGEERRSMDLKTMCGFSALVLATHFGVMVNCGAEDLPIGRLGSTNYGDWRTTGTAFNSGPASGGVLSRLKIENARDNGVASSDFDGDGPTGTLTSPEFKIARKYISFLIAGGDYERDTVSEPGSPRQNRAQRHRLEEQPLGASQLGCQPVAWPNCSSPNCR